MIIGGVTAEGSSEFTTAWMIMQGDHDPDTCAMCHGPWVFKLRAETTEIERKSERTVNFYDELDRQLREDLAQRRRETELARRRAAYDALGDDRVEGAVLAFERVFPAMIVTERREKTYRYAAVRSGGRWYVTGGAAGTPQGVDWDELKTWLVSGVSPVTEVTYLRPAVAPESVTSDTNSPK